MKHGWDYKKLGELVQVLNGYAFKSSLYENQGIRVLRITNVQKGNIVDDDPKYYPLSLTDEIRNYLLKESDLLMSLTGNVGRVGLLTKEMLPAALNQRVACLRILSNGLNLGFLFHYLNSDKFEQDAVLSAKGIAQKNMSTEWLKDYKLPLPPISVQQTIVSELDKINELIRLKKEQLSDYDKLAQSLFYEMFGDPIENEKGWEKKRLGEVCSEIKYGTSKPACDNGKYKYLRMCNLSYDGYLDLADIKRIDVSDEEIEKCIVRYGDILFNRTNSHELIGKTCMFDQQEPMVIAGYIIRVRLTKELMPQVLARMFNLASIKKLLRSMAKGAVNQANINSKELASIQIPIPSLDLQQHFVKRIELIEQQKAEIKSTIAALETLLASRMQYWFD